MTIDKTYSGVVSGRGKGQMVSKRTDGGIGIYFAIEEFSGTVAGMQGTFTLVHRGFMSKDSKSLEIDILEGTATGALEGISGSMSIDQDDDGHAYSLVYEL